MNLLRVTLSVFALMVAALPASSNYKMGSYGFGSGGTAGSGSTNYKVQGEAGEVSGKGASTNYKAGAGENYVKQADVPKITISNPASYYNKLLVVVDPQANPSDAKFAIAISTDGFTTTQYVKSDFTIGSSLTFPTDYLTYAGWGGASGFLVRGLARSTVYTVKAKAYRGHYTESGYGPTSNATTADPQLTFDVDVAATDISTSPPYNITFGTLPVSTVTDSPTRVWVSLGTNGESGGKIYLSGQNTGLKSLGANYTISSTSTDLAVAAEGFGAQGVTATQSAGGPLVMVAPYDGTAANVGITDTLIREIFSTTAPITSGRGSFILKAKTKPLTPSSGDYTEILTAIASASF